MRVIKRRCSNSKRIHCQKKVNTCYSVGQPSEILSDELETRHERHYTHILFLKVETWWTVWMYRMEYGDIGHPTFLNTVKKTSEFQYVHVYMQAKSFTHHSNTTVFIPLLVFVSTGRH
jgi:hypothetical protein